VPREKVFSRQKRYLEMLGDLQNATIINSLDIFCPGEESVVFSDGELLYQDNNHLSTAGSKFQIERQLLPYLVIKGKPSANP
jgi:hypothetical protein